MADFLPLLIFPRAKTVPPPVGRPMMIGKPHFPDHGTQVKRLSGQIAEVKSNFEKYRAEVSGAVAGLEPEAVLVIEIAGRVEDFKQAVEAAGLEWLGEWDLEDFEPTDEFYEVDSKGKRSTKIVSGRLFLSMVNEAGLAELLSLWSRWQNEKAMPYRLGKWKDIFSQIVVIRRWGIEESLDETGMINLWNDLLDPVDINQKITFQIELFYRDNVAKRRLNEAAVVAMLAELDGRTLGAFIDLKDISFHAVKAEIPAVAVQQLLSDLNSPTRRTDIHLFQFSSIMYFRPTGQSLIAVEDGEGDLSEIEPGNSELDPIVALLDGVPNLNHPALRDRVLFDDPENLAEKYRLGERKHASSMASLLVHGELDDGDSVPLTRKVYIRPILEPHEFTRDEHVPDNVFLEDRIHLAVRRMFEGAEDVPPQAPGVKIINLSVGDPFRPFVHTPSPLARLLDWLSWKYRVLICVSAGNYLDDIDVGISTSEFVLLSDEDKIIHTLKCVERQLSGRRLLSPAEAMNVLTVGSTHADNSGEFKLADRVDLLPSSATFSLVSRLGHGFRKSVKPEIFFPGGRQLYKVPPAGTVLKLDKYKSKPGQRVAWDSDQQGELGKCVHTRGTSNATALSTRGGARIHEVLLDLQQKNGDLLDERFFSILIKTLLVHGARHDKDAKAAITKAIKTPQNGRKLKEMLSRYMGYGTVDIERVLTCTEQRGTVLGVGEIGAGKVHEFRFPIPPALANRKDWRRLVVTLAWFTPINPDHRNLREAKLELSSKGAWDEIALRLTRQDADHNQIHRGTVQHEVLESEKAIAAFQEGEEIILHIACKADATNVLDVEIPYGIAVTLEVKDGVDIPIYTQLRAMIQPQVQVKI
ncbi:S8 family peptidase [Undibacterium danionis]|uniref:S8 family peptidase n=1 Tax=Undibacterium danionis TaxID=1812100 RepID=A0ABV6IDF5_9BURK